MPIEPDHKDWTWVLGRPCPQCGLDVRAVPLGAISEMIRSNALSWHEILLRSADVERRPNPSRWSTLEYGCHVRDVLRLYDVRLRLMLSEDDPLFANWDQDRTAVAEHYGEQDPVAVSAELEEAADRLANDFDQVTDAQWERPGRRSDGAVFTVSTFARYFIHDPVHHLHDVTS